jgi:hypothetical protein
MGDAIGVDSAAALTLMDRYPFTFLIEDPATVWHLGAGRYSAIAERYAGLTPHSGRLAIDLNIVDRYQDVYPTKQQTGTELLLLVRQAAASFPRVALYFEASIQKPDVALLPAAAAAVRKFERIGPKTIVDSVSGVGIPWRGPAMVDGQPWPVSDGETLWLPAGAHSVEAGRAAGEARVTRLNAELKTARLGPAGEIEFSYLASARAIAVLNRPPRSVWIDGDLVTPVLAGPLSLVLPRGQHFVTIATE